MKFKNPVLDRFFRSKKEEDSSEEAVEHPVQEEVPPPSEPSELKLPPEHALYRLYDLRMEQAGELPPPRLLLEGLEELSASKRGQEIGRLRMIVTKEAVARLEKAVPKPQKKKTENAGKAEKTSDGAKAEEAEEEEPLPIELDALPFVYVSADKMRAWIMVFPSVGDGRELEGNMLESLLAEKGITFGLDEELLERLPEEPDRYFRLFPVARGKEAVDGENGYFVDAFPRSVKWEFDIDEHGRVDYTSRHPLMNVKKGDLICEAIPPTQGVPGSTVYGKAIPCRDGRAVSLPKGRNTEISEDGRRLLAASDGRVEFNGRNFQIKLVLEIYGNVDYSSRNINFLGDVHIHGDVCSGFSVRATGNITVDGVVEAGIVEAGGDLIVAKGIVGNMETIVRAHRDVYAKYLENCIVHARGNLQTDCILYSDVYSDGEVQVCTGRGAIVGGRIRAGKKVSAKIVGSRYESATSIIIGGQPCMDFDKEVVLKRIKDLQKEMEVLERQPDSPSRSQRMGKIKLDLSVGEMKLNKYEKESGEPEEKQEEVSGCLECGIAYRGLTLMIGDETAHLAEEINSCNARLIGGKIYWL